MLERIAIPDFNMIKPKKLTDHPIGVGRNPHRYCQVMAKFRHVLTGSVGNDNRNEQSGKNHRSAQPFETQAPGHVFE